MFGNALLQQQNLLLDAAGLSGRAAVGQTAKLSADTLTFSNHNATANAVAATGRGDLVVNTQNLLLDQGAYALTGFKHITFNAAGQLSGSGTGKLGVSGDLLIHADQIISASGADTAIDASGYAVALASAVNAAATALIAAKPGLGARWAIQADAIDMQVGRFVLPTGQVHLDALRSDLTLGQGASINVAGRALPLGDSTVYTGGGRVTLRAEQGDIRLPEGAAIDVSATTAGGDAGVLELSAPQGQVTVAAALAGSAGAKAKQGSFALDAQSLAAGQLPQITRTLADAGFSADLTIRQRQGDMDIPGATTIKADVIHFSADQGQLTLAGTLDAQAAQDGTVALDGGRGVSLTGNAAILAQATEGQGGRVTLDASVGKGSGDSTINMAPGTSIDVSGATDATGGKVTLRAFRVDGDQGIAIDSLAGTLRGGRVEAQGVAVYQDDGLISRSDISTWKTATGQYMQSAAAIEARLGQGATLIPALDVRSNGDLTLQDGWNLLDWRYNGQPGVLTLRAEGHLNLRADLSDAFANGAISTQFGDVPITDKLQTGQSWSYQLLAGGDVALAKGVQLRTSTGSISVAAGRDLLLGDHASPRDNNAVIYTAGRPTDVNRYGSFNDALVGYLFYGEYPVDGGAIHLTAGRNIQGAGSRQMFSDWLARTGTWSAAGALPFTLPTAFAVNLSGKGFKQGVGALGGGTVRLQAGGNIADLAVVIPTTGKPIGTPNSPGSFSDITFDNNEVQVLGGGDLQVQAAGDITGGLYYTGRGTATVAAGGGVGGADHNAPWFAMGSGQLSVSASNDLTVGGVFNPTILPQPSDTQSANRSYFFTYDATGSANFLSLGRNVILQNDVDQWLSRTDLGDLADTRTTRMLQVYPGQVQAIAPVGDIRIERDFLLFPAASGNLSLAAGGNITTSNTGSAVTVTQSDADPALLPNIHLPTGDLEDAYNRLQPYGSANVIHAARRTLNKPLSPAMLSGIKLVVDAESTREAQRLGKNMVLLTIAISGGPFLGLLGTVVGTMITFAAIAATGDVNINAIAPGIAAALAATVAGLLVAIPALFAYNYLTTQIKEIVVEMHIFADEFVHHLTEQVGE